jgi:hypothetical protein
MTCHVVERLELTGRQIERIPTVKKERRWLKSAIAASAGDIPAMPWQRGMRRKPQAMKPVVPKSAAIAAR